MPALKPSPKCTRELLEACGVFAGANPTIESLPTVQMISNYRVVKTRNSQLRSRGAVTTVLRAGSSWWHACAQRRLGLHEKIDWHAAVKVLVETPSLLLPNWVRKMWQL